ncbi:hypothetical protein [Candidatus Uabimicrobium amorphum]|uniref:Uncharacterized protein n=1 Tax=Uabimicrobium amorphum TaxID=2596890 RepID=A0A5S9F6L1_UABAM|nr:hypothetical protein [Candidatus Uabimicrobium amorphum]BBM87996.1 hypothetical protein UABAM_06412 [Candidatus Uabimicrobium amorphum]
MKKSPQQQVIYSILLFVFIATGVRYGLFHQLALSQPLSNEELLLTQEITSLTAQKNKYIRKQRQCQQATAFLLTKVTNSGPVVIAQQKYSDKDLQGLLQQMQLRDKDLHEKIVYLQKVIGEKNQQVTKFRKLKDYKEEQHIDIRMHKQQVLLLQQQIKKLREKIAQKQKYIAEKKDNINHKKKNINKVIELLCDE